jgi:hypothetical protein
MKNALIHVVDFLHHFVFRHRWGCFKLAESSWWSCDGQDTYCHRFDWAEE